jgi:predicted enzyme related to lactoylglutathione lyase
MTARVARTIAVVLAGGVFALTSLARGESPPNHDLLDLEVKSQSKDFAMLQSGNVGVFLSSGHWDWDEKRPNSARPGWGMYPHFAVADVAATVGRARKAGYHIAQEPRRYNWGTEAFVTDPDGYVCGAD